MIHKSATPTQVNFQPPAPIPGVSFRLASEQDLEMLWQNCYPETDWPQFQDHYNYLLKWQKNGRCAILIAETISQTISLTPDSPTIIGSSQLIRRGDTAEIAELFVHPNHRNQGIGSALIDILTQIAQEQKTSILEIGADTNNQAALRLYRRLGFGSERTLCLPNGQEAVILNKNLAQRWRDEI
jgi:ribosomal protein S18 acetylase RimI-like enzyme